MQHNPLLATAWPVPMLPRIAVLVITCMSWAGCSRPLPPAPVVKQTTPVSISVIADVGGRLLATNCGAANPGGLDRLHHYLQQTSTKGRPYLLNVGGSQLGQRAADLQLWQTTLKAQSVQASCIHNLGTEECGLSELQLTQLSDQTGVKWLSTNVLQADGDYVAEPVQILQLGSESVMVLGVVSPSLVDEKTFRIQEPVAAIQQALRDYEWNANSSHRLLVLGDLTATDAQQVRSQLPATAKLILREREDIAAQTFKPSEQTTVCAQHGIAVTEISLATVATNKGPQRRVESIILDENWQPAAPPRWLAHHFQELQRQQWTAQDFTQHVPQMTTVAALQGYAGQQSCVACHAAECTSTMHTAHAKAWQSLVDRGQQQRHECQTCHTTGFGENAEPTELSGFVSAIRTPHLLAVQCESCHGPSHAHALMPSLRTPGIALESCQRCHTPEHSPKFEAMSAWSRIQHGQ
jgi:hypothetical protein